MDFFIQIYNLGTENQNENRKPHGTTHITISTGHELQNMSSKKKRKIKL